jgi:hypothetical protein
MSDPKHCLRDELEAGYSNTVMAPFKQIFRNKNTHKMLKKPSRETGKF